MGKEIMDERYTKLTAIPDATVRMLLGYVTDMDMALTRATCVKYVDALVDDIRRPPQHIHLETTEVTFK